MASAQGVLEAAVSTVDPTLLALLRQQSEAYKQQQDMFMALLKKGESKDEEGGSKRKREESSYSPQEPVVFLDEAYSINDDAHEKVDTVLRQKLRPINAAPSTYWVKGAFKQVERPIIGASLYLEHIMAGHVNEATICKAHDRCAYIEIKNFLSKNANVESKNKKEIKVHLVSEDQFGMGVRTQWEQATSVWEVVDAAWNYLSVEFMVRNYSYTAIAQFRCLHECR